MADDLYVTAANSLNLREEPGLESRVLGVLAKGTQVARTGGDPAGAWWPVKRAAPEMAGYVARRYLAPISNSPLPLLPGVNETIWAATQAALAAGVAYLLGEKNSRTGRIDCSGWVDELTVAAFDAVNRAAAPEAVFSDRMKAVLQTHSDGIVTGVEARTGWALHGAQVSLANLREGMLVGCNFGEHGWESGGPRRVYGIDHIVQVVRDPASGAMFVSQSSSSGGGVNLQPLAGWLTARERSGMTAADRIHAVDPFGLADRHTAYMRQLEPPATTSSAGFSGLVAPAAPRTAGPAAATGRGAYLYTISETVGRYGSVAAAVAEMRRCRLDHLWVRIHGRGYVGDAKGADPARLRELIAAAKAAGIAVAGWGWWQGEDVASEAALAAQAIQTFGVATYVADIEQGVNGARWTAQEVGDALQAVRPHVGTLGLTSHGFIDWHEPAILTAGAALADFVNPQAYWGASYPNDKMLKTVASTPAIYPLADPASYARLCADRYAALYGRPVVVTGQAYATADMTDEDVEAKLAAFLHDHKPAPNVVGVNVWHWGAMTRAMRDALAAA